MTMTITITIIIILILILSITQNIQNIEDFSVVGYNAEFIPNNSLNISFYEKMTSLNKEFFKQSIDNNFDKSNFTLYNNSLSFPFTSKFSSLLLDFIKKTPQISSHKIAAGIFNNIYYYDDKLNNRFFILNVNLNDTTDFTVRNVKVKYKVKNIALFLTPSKAYYTSYSIPLLDSNCSILGVTLDSNNFASYNMPGIDNLNPTSLYLIENKLHLLNPFLTAGGEMVITQKMKKDYNKKIANINRSKNGTSNTISNVNSVGA